MIGRWATTGVVQLAYTGEDGGLGHCRQEPEGLGCTRAELMQWLDHPMLRAVVVQTHLDVVHEKILTVPLGIERKRIKRMFSRLEKLKENYPKKLRLVLINNSCQCTGRS